MGKYRFKIGTKVMCNLGQHGWKLGRIIALDYHEDGWTEQDVAPYQVALLESHSLIYVPKDDDRFCRLATDEDIKILSRSDALAKLHGVNEQNSDRDNSMMNSNLCCSADTVLPKYHSYRKGKCYCCNDCPRNWLYAELYSEHYRCSTRNELTITHHKIELPSINVGESIDYELDESVPVKCGFLQAPTLVRLPPGVIFSDEGKLSGQLCFDPYRKPTYEVNFVAVSTAAWENNSVGIIRLEMCFKVTGNNPPANFAMASFEDSQTRARKSANKLLDSLNKTWSEWESSRLTNRVTCENMLGDLSKLRELLATNPRLDNGKWWGHLGGYHMNVHKLLENTLFECELYLGYALTFGDDGVRYYAEQNLRGCYQKRLLEAARFMWYDGIELMLQNQWDAAIELFRAAQAKKEGWGWAVNYGDIWLCEAVCIIIGGIEADNDRNQQDWLGKADELIKQAQTRTAKSGAFDNDGHPWISAVVLALEHYQILTSSGKDLTQWREEFYELTVYWCSQVLAGMFPFPPKPRPRLAIETSLVELLPSHNDRAF